MRIKCQGCSEWLEVPDRYAGQRGRCKKCGGSIHVPEIEPRQSLVTSKEASHRQVSGVEWVESASDRSSDHINSPANITIGTALEGSLKIPRRTLLACAGGIALVVLALPGALLSGDSKDRTYEIPDKDVRQRHRLPGRNDTEIQFQVREIRKSPLSGTFFLLRLMQGEAHSPLSISGDFCVFDKNGNFLACGFASFYNADYLEWAEDYVYIEEVAPEDVYDWELLLQSVRAQPFSVGGFVSLDQVPATDSTGDFVPTLKQMKEWADEDK